MKLMRVGDKLINREKIDRTIDAILQRRAEGLSQQEVAKDLKIDRTFVSRLETLGEVRKGGTIAVVGFPLANIPEIKDVCDEFGVEYTMLMSENERYGYIDSRAGWDLVNEIMRMIAFFRTFDTVILIGSDFRNRLSEALLDNQVVTVYIGESPIREDKHLEPQRLRDILSAIREGGPIHETRSERESGIEQA
jgi:hypothetical protein